LETASTPVIALQPSANARMRRSRPSGSAPTGIGFDGDATGTWPNAVRTRPVPMSASMDSRNTYVGMANTVPLSRTPRRFTTITSRISIAETGTTRCSTAPGKADAIAATPAATLTETVRT
jgi:hypothetical protein